MDYLEYTNDKMNGAFAGPEPLPLATCMVCGGIVDRNDICRKCGTNYDEESNDMASILHAPAATKEQLMYYIESGDYTIISAESNDPNATPEHNAERTHIFSQFLKLGNVTFFPVRGKWEGTEESSFMIPHLHVETAIFLVRVLGQECALVGNIGLVFGDGSVLRENGELTINGNETDNYSEVLLPNGERIKFSVGIDYGDDGEVWFAEGGGKILPLKVNPVGTEAFA